MTQAPARFRLAFLAGLVLTSLWTDLPLFGGTSPVTEQSRLLARDGETGDRFGNSVAFSGDVAIVGALEDGGGQGAAYLFLRSESGWLLQDKLTSAESGWLGLSVAVSGDTAVVSEVYGHPVIHYSGVVHVFVRNGSNWLEQAQLFAPDAQLYDGFGNMVAISGDTIAVGAPAGSKGPFLNGSGAVYVFVRQGTSWSLQAKVVASDAQAGDALGAVALSGDTLLAGASNRQPAGAVYVFRRNGSSWNEQHKILSPDGRAFGARLAWSGETLLVGAPPRTNEPTGEVGAAYVYVGQGASWSLQGTLLAPPGGSPFARFGSSVALSGDTAVVGAAMFHANWISAVFAFLRTGTRWSGPSELLASDGESWDAFGISLAIAGGTVMVGAPWADNPEIADDVGAVYLFSAAGVEVSPTAGMFTFEIGSTAPATVVLDTEPAGDVVIDLVSSDPGEGTVSPARLTFTPGDWNTPQTVTLTGVEDFVDDNGKAYTVALTLNQELTEDSIYDGIDPGDVTAVNLQFGGDFYSVAPCRVLDTRQPDQGPLLTSGIERVVAFHETCGVPATARAVAISVTVVDPTGDGSLVLHPADLPLPGIDTVVFKAGRSRTHHAIVLLAADGTGLLKVAPLVADGGATHLAIDLAGYFE